MDIHPRPSLFLLVSSLLMLYIFSALLAPLPVQADVGVRPVLPGGSDIKPEGETPIQMAAEKVVMTVRPASEADNAAIELNPEAYGYHFQPVWFPAVAEVKANFTMKNPTGEPVSMTVWFPLASALENVSWELNPDEIVPRIANFKVRVDEKPVEVTQGELPNPQGEDRPPLPWASFPVTFPPGKKTNIHVSYLLPLHQSIKGTELALYYVFQTGAGWAGPIGKAELVVELPYPASEATLAGAAPGKFSLPYSAPGPAVLPPGAVLEGNTARWTWTDFEPGPEDDFAIWLLHPALWQELSAARSRVKAHPQDGQAWLELASIYRSLATMGYDFPSIFSPSYLEPGLEAYREAARLLPEHPAPHAGLALLALAPYMRAKDAPPEVIHTVREEMQIARELEAQNPSLAEEAGISSSMVEEILEIYGYNDATATAEVSFSATRQAAQTAAAAPTGTPRPATALAQATAIRATPVPSLTPTPRAIALQTAAPTPVPPVTVATRTGFGLTLFLLAAAGLVFLVVVGFLILRGRISR
jgi:hypothetical protein